MDIDALVKRINAKLKKRCNPLRLRRRGGVMWARGTLPVKPHMPHRRPYQQMFSLHKPANPEGVRQAERLVIQLGADLQLGQWTWDPWINDGYMYVNKAGEWVRRFEHEYWLNRPRKPSTINNWKVYDQIIGRIPKEESLTLELLIDVLCQYDPDTRRRQQAAMVLSKVADFADIPNKGIKALSGNYSTKSVNARQLPVDSYIDSTIYRITHPGWRWIAGMMATYGLRNHEVFHLDMSQWPTVWVGENTKTGSRFVYPVYPIWADRWDLQNRIYPNLTELKKPDPATWDNAKLGRKISAWFGRMMPFKPYDLRHCYSQRCFQHKMPADMVAKLMGHSLTIQLDTYRSWWGEAAYKKIYDELVTQGQEIYQSGKDSSQG